jgi:hypothetical protein
MLPGMDTTRIVTSALLPSEAGRLARQEFIRLAMIVAEAKGSAPAAVARVQALRLSSRLQMAVKAAVPASSTVDSEALVAYGQLQTAFLGSIASCFDRVAASGAMVPLLAMGRVGFTAASFSAPEVGEGAAIPLARYTVGLSTLLPRKIAAIVVLSAELARFSGASSLVERALRDAIAIGSDIVFTALLSAQNLPIPSTGDSSRDLAALLDAVPPVAGSSLFLVWPLQTIRALAALRNTAGTRLWPELTVSGGSMLGIPCLGAAPGVIDGSGLLLDAAQLAGSSGDVAVDSSRQADLNMSPDGQPAMVATTLGSPPTSIASDVISLFATGSIGIRATRSLVCEPLRASACASLSGVAYGAPQ